MLKIKKLLDPLLTYIYMKPFLKQQQCKINVIEIAHQYSLLLCKLALHFPLIKSKIFIQNKNDD